MSEQESQFLLILFGGIFFAFLMTLFVVAMVILHRQRQSKNRQKIEQLRSDYEKTLLNIENEIQHETLTHVGRELHDNIGQLLSLAKLNLNSAKPEKQAEGKEFINQLIKEVRTLSKTLNLDWVEEIRMDDFVKQQLQRIESTGYCQIIFNSDHSLNELPKDVKLVMIRVIQECLNNAIKHAAPSTIEITITQDSIKRKIEILDDGQGFDISMHSNGSGITNLRKRMEAIGGTIIISSVPGKGTHITLSLPF
jgi:two-component system NarL family sensor kinase